MTDLAPFVDLELAVMDLLGDLAPTGTVTPPNLADELPFIRVTRYGGGDNLITDTARLDIDTFATSWPACKALAEQVRQRLLSWPHTTSAGVIDRVSTDTGPHQVPWDNPNVRCFAAAYRVTGRRR
ncbi:MAG TPA: hypothetical protein VHB02_06030 [Acidimicrobiales bacterium]|nr:hypothetical protein [Acidimicrobiales bacterium]